MSYRLNHKGRMKAIRTSIAKLTTCVVALCASAVQADVQTFAFTASIYYMWEYDAVSKVNTTVESTTFAGSLITKADLVHGVFAYNSDALPSPGYQPHPPTTGTDLIFKLDKAVANMSFRVGDGPVSFQSGSAPIAIVGNDNSNSYGWDTLYLAATKAFDPVMFHSANLALYDPSGSAFLTGGMPTSLNLNSFGYKRLTGSWLRRADGNQMHFWATLTTLTPVVSSVPEPSSVALLLVGLGAFGWVRSGRQA